MGNFCVSVNGTFCGGRLRFRVLRNFFVFCGKNLYIHPFVFQLILIDIKVYMAENENPMLF